MSSIHPSGPATEGGPTETVRAAVVPRLGGRLGRYELIEVVGRGAMATVFRARDTQLAREVAVKVMGLAVAARAESAERFRREAQAVAAVKHPGIVEIFDFVGATLTEPAYIVSELIEGPTLRQFLDERRGRLLPEAAALVAIPIAEALAVAHSRGIIHRDIKPDNVMMARGGDKHRVVLTDFGVAHITGLETMTATGALVGSPAFMSPEQARGHGVGPASDLWAVGVLLYEMATGHLPFPGRDALMVVASIARGLYKKPSAVSAYVGGGLDEICGRCLRLEPKDRYPDLAGLVTDLRAFCAAGGLIANERSVRALISDPGGFETALRPQVADAAVAQARRHSRRGELGRALGELARASAYVPNHAEANRLVASISFRRRWLKVGGAVASVLAAAAAVVFLVPRVRVLMDRLAAAPAVVEQPVEAWPQAAVLPVTAGALDPQPAAAMGRAGPPPSRATEPRSVTPTSQGGARAPRNKLKANGNRRRGPPPRLSKAESALMYEGAKNPEELTALAVAPAPQLLTEPPPPAPTPTRPKPVVVEMFAERFFCHPSLDDKPAAVTPKYTVLEGQHRVYCSNGGRKLFVKNIHIASPPDGGKFRIQLMKVAQGEFWKPVLDLANTTRPRQVDPGAR